MFFSGIADEAASELRDQIRAHMELDWKHIEIRNIGGTNLTDLSDEEFDRVAATLEENQLQVSCFASQLANWSRPIDSDFAVDVAELERAIPRMQRLGTRFIRCMSYPNSDPPLEDQEWRRRAVERLKKLARMAEDGGVILVHENCNGWGGQGPQQSTALLADVGSEHLKFVYDTGNPIQYGQSAWDYYSGLQREDIVYVHIKDYIVEDGKTGDDKACFPGEGAGYVRQTIADLLAHGYDGGFSIEPHITSVIHLQQEASDPELAFKTYVEYGRRLEKLVAEIRDSGS